MYQGVLAGGRRGSIIVDLSANKVLCSFHPLPFKDTWNEPDTIIKVTSFIIQLFKVLVNDEEFISLCGGDSDFIERNLPRPLCCWVAVHYPNELIAAYHLVGFEPPNAEVIARLN